MKVEADDASGVLLIYFIFIFSLCSYSWVLILFQYLPRLGNNVLGQSGNLETFCYFLSVPLQNRAGYETLTKSGRDPSMLHLFGILA